MARVSCCGSVFIAKKVVQPLTRLGANYALKNSRRMKIPLIVSVDLIRIMENGMVGNFLRLHHNFHVVDAGPSVEGHAGHSSFVIGFSCYVCLAMESM